MIVKTRIHGAEELVNVTPDRVFAFEPPLGGFPDLRRYVLIADEGSPVEWLQSVDEPGMALAVLEPFLVVPGYSFELGQEDAEALGMESPEDAMVRCVVTVREDPSEITANLLAPLVFSRRAHLARQVILQDSGYPLRHPLLGAAELAASA